ncbi:MAG: S-adenosylmethionine:tRNA ribosyltransferase-isomerase [Flavobacteriales bacterium]|jgi:S-adenosylmethionine:tRNA ribosyltransferase-isomerase
MNNPRLLRIEDFDYNLPDHAIAAHPRPNRDDSRLMACIKGEITPDYFKNIKSYLDESDLLVLNETKVIPARLYFRKDTGALIEIFCLQPFQMDHQQAMERRDAVEWEVMIGGAKKWKEGVLKLDVKLGDHLLELFAERTLSSDSVFTVRFFWNNPNISFSEILSAAGELPLPPYFDRKAEAADYERYQTVFAKFEGSVAAPTAGLHFTPSILSQIEQQGVNIQKLVLHVGSGTFKPVSASLLEEHEMHGEVFEVTPSFIEALIKPKGRTIPVGTTCMRTIESLYWLGVKYLHYPEQIQNTLVLNQWEAYDLPQNVSRVDALTALLEYCEKYGLKKLGGSTSLIIAPGYQLRVASGIITNFHLPKSTLILLVAAIIGEQWREVYAKALEENFYFLSYGDSSILIP